MNEIHPHRLIYIERKVYALSGRYAALLFAQAGLAFSEASFLTSGVSAIVIFGGTIPALLFSDK